MITLRAVPAYSHATPVAPAGRVVVPPPLTTMGGVRVTPRAVPTVAADGQVPVPAVVDWPAVGVVVAAAAEVAAEVAAAVADAVAPGGATVAEGVPPLALPHAASARLQMNVVSANESGLRCDT